MTIAKGLLLAAAGNNTIQPLGNLVASCLFDTDATIAASYTSGQVWNNYEPTPADGSAQSAYNFNRGAGSGSEASDPTFNGSAGSPSAYWSFDGGDYFSIAGGNTTLLNDMAKSAASINVGFCAVFRPSNVSLSNMLLSTQGTNRGATFFSSGGNQRLTIAQVGTVAVTADSNPNTLSNGVDYFVAATWNRGTNQASLWINGTAFTGLSFTFSTTTNNGQPLLIGARGDVSNFFPNNTRLYAASMFNETLDSAKVAKIRRQYELRHQRSYA